MNAIKKYGKEISKLLERLKYTLLKRKFFLTKFFLGVYLI